MVSEDEEWESIPKIEQNTVSKLRESLDSSVVEVKNVKKSIDKIKEEADDAKRRFDSIEKDTKNIDKKTKENEKLVRLFIIIVAITLVGVAVTLVSVWFDAWTYKKDFHGDYADKFSSLEKENYDLQIKLQNQKIQQLGKEIKELKSKTPSSNTFSHRKDHNTS